MRSHVLRTARIHNTITDVCAHVGGQCWCVQPVQSIALPYILIHPRKRVRRNRLAAGHWPRRFSTMSGGYASRLFFSRSMSRRAMLPFFQLGVEIVFPTPIFLRSIRQCVSAIPYASNTASVKRSRRCSARNNRRSTTHFRSGFTWCLSATLATRRDTLSCVCISGAYSCKKSIIF